MAVNMSGFGSRRPTAEYISDEERDSLLSTLASKGMNFIGDLGWGLDTPGAFVRSGIHGLSTGEWKNPLSDERVSGREMLKGLGLDTGNGWIDAPAGFVAEAALDPLALLTGPANALGLAGRATKATGLLDDAARVASKTLSGEASTALQAGLKYDVPSFAQNTLKGMGAQGDDLTEAAAKYAEHYGRPLVGRREAYRTSTIDDILPADPLARLDAEKRLTDYLSAQSPGTTLDSIRGEKLGKQFGLALPFAKENFAAFDLPGGAQFGDAMDRVADATRWGAAGRKFYALTDKSVSGQGTALEQAIASKINHSGDVGEAKAGREWVDRIGYDAVRSPTDLHTVEMGERMARLMEQPKSGPLEIASNEDLLSMSNVPALKNTVDQWDEMRQEILRDGKRLGVPSAELEHPYGLGYMPYKENIPGFNATSKRKVFDPETGDMLHRAEYNKLPGGVSQLQELSSNPMIAGKNRTLASNYVQLDAPKASDEDVARYIFNAINDPLDERLGMHGGTGTPFTSMPQYSMDNAMGLGRMLNKLDEAKPLFGMHPLESTLQYTQGRGRSHGITDSLLDTVAGHTVDGAYTAIPGGGHISIGEALRTRLGLQDGAIDEVARRYAAMTGKTVDPSKLAIKEDLVDSLSRMADAYQSPKAQGTIANGLKLYNQFFKAKALLWPAAKVRDFYSSAIGNIIEAGPESATMLPTAASLLNGDYAGIADAVNQIPRYRNMPAGTDKIKELLLDAGEARVLSGMGTAGTDLGDRTADAVKTMMPGSSPVSLSESFSPLFRDASAKASDWHPLNLRGMPDGKGGNLLDTTNPLFKVGENIGDYSDSVIRLSGWLSLLKQGVDPVEASRRMRRQHIDYQSLTPFEKSIRDKWVPFYTFESRAAARTIGDLVDRPGGRTAQSLRFINRLQDGNKDEYLPERLRSQPSIPIPEIVGDATEALGLGNLAKTPNGEQRYLSNIEWPSFPSLSKPVIKRDAEGWVDPYQSLLGTLQNYASSTAPIPKGVAELVFDRDLYQKRPLGDVTTPADMIAQTLTGREDSKAPEAVNALLRVAPFFSRELTFAKGLMDDKQGTLPERALATGVRAATGLTVTAATEDEKRYDAQKQGDFLLRRYSKSFRKPVIPEDVLLTLPPALQQAYQLNRRLDKDRADAKKRAQKLGLVD